MKKEDAEKILGMWGVGIIVSISTLGSLYLKGLTTGDILEAISAIGTAVIPIVASLTAVTMIASRGEKEKYFDLGKEALRRLQKKHSDLLSGPKTNKADGDKGDEDNSRVYLFFQKPSEKQRAQLIPARLFKQFIIEIHIPVKTLLILGCKKDEALSKQKWLRENIYGSIKRLIGQLKVDEYAIEEGDGEDIAVIVTFDENDITPKKFGQMVEVLGEEAFNIIVRAAKVADPQSDAMGVG